MPNQPLYFMNKLCYKEGEWSKSINTQIGDANQFIMHITQNSSHKANMPCPEPVGTLLSENKMFNYLEAG